MYKHMVSECLGSGAGVLVVSMKQVCGSMCVLFEKSSNDLRIDIAAWEGRSPMTWSRIAGGPASIEAEKQGW